MRSTARLVDRVQCSGSNLKAGGVAVGALGLGAQRQLHRQVLLLLHALRRRLPVCACRALGWHHASRTTVVPQHTSADTRGGGDEYACKSRTSVCGAKRTSGESVHEIFLRSAGGLACGIVSVALRAAHHSLRERAGSGQRSATHGGHSRHLFGV
jgi:hypothetical protein